MRIGMAAGGAIFATGAAGLLLAGCARRGRDERPDVAPTPTPTPTPTPAPRPPLRIGQLNAWNLFDTVDAPRVQDTVYSQEEYERRLGKLGLAIRDTMGAPDIVAMQEVEHEGVLRDLAARPELREFGYAPLLVEGSDPRGIDVGYLYRPARVELLHHEQRRTTYVSPAGRNIQLFTRPPLVATFRPRPAAGATEDASAGAAAVTLVNNHFTSQLQGETGAHKRMLQAQFVASIADGRAGVAMLDPRRTIVLGDLNETLGDPAYELLVAGTAETGPAFLNAASRLPEADRYSWRDGSRRLLLDHVLLAPALDASLGAVAIPHINSDPSPLRAQDPTTPERSSDHDPVVIELRG